MTHSDPSTVLSLYLAIVLPVATGTAIHCGDSSSLALFLHLHTSHTTKRLFALDSFLFASLQYFFILHAQLASLNIKTIECRNYRISILREAKICKCEAPESALRIDVIIERIRRGDRK